MDEQSIMRKELQHDATLYPRDAIFATDSECHTARMTRLCSIARCAWSRDLKPLHTLAAHSSLATEHLVVENGVPALVRPQDSEEAMRAARSEHSDRAGADSENESRSISQMSSADRKKAKADAIARLPGLWVPVAPRIMLIGSRTSSEEAEHCGILICQLPIDISGMVGSWT